MSSEAEGQNGRDRGGFNAYQATLLFLPVFAVSLGYGAVLPILPSLLQRLHAAQVDVALALHAGLLTGIYVGAFVIAAPIWGKLCDLRGSRVVLITGLAGYAAATAWLGLVTSLDEAYVARFVAGIFAAGLFPATSALISRRTQGEQRAQHLGWVNAASGVGFLVGPALTGWIHEVMAASRPAAADTSHITAVAIWTTGAIALGSAISLFWSSQYSGPPRPQAPAQSLPDKAHPQAVLSRRGILILSAFGAFGVGVFEVGLTLQSQRFWRWSPGELAGLFALCSVMMLAIQFALFAPLRRALGPRRLVIGGFGMMAVGFAFLSATSIYRVVAGLVAAIAFGAGVVLPTLSVATADLSQQHVGTATGLQNAVGNLGQAAGSVMAGVLFSALPGISFRIVAAVMLLTAVWAAWGLSQNASARSLTAC